MTEVPGGVKGSPLDLIREAIKAVPAVKYALGVAGVAAALALAVAMLDLRVAAFGTVIMFAMMVVLVLFAKLASIASKDLRLPVLVLTWAMLVLTLAVAVFLVTSIFFQRPLDLKSWLVRGQADARQSERPAEPAPAGDLMVTFRGGGATLDCGKLSRATAVLRQADGSRKARLNARCTATFAGVGALPREATIALADAAGWVVQTQEPGVDGRSLVVTLGEASGVPRLHLAMLPFQTPDNAAQAAFEQFRAALTEKTFALSQQFGARGTAFDYVTNLRVSNEGPPLASFAELRTFWNQNHALQLVRGNVDSGSTPITVHSVVFLGELAPSPQHMGLRLSMKVTPSEFGSTRDTYSLVILYALARDAQRMGKPGSVVSAFLAEAFSILQDLENPPAEVAPISNAVTEMLRSVTAVETGP